MEPMTIREILQAVDGRMLGEFGDLNREVSRVETDSRTIHAGSLFVPLMGERFDGHAYINAALEGGAAGCFTQRERESYLPGKFYIKVSSTQKALRDLAKYYKKKFSIPVVALTGSVGKTTTKDMVAPVLGEKYKVLKTEGNFNNEVGLPLTLLRPLSGSGALVVFQNILSQFGPDSQAGEIASVLIGSTETTFYTIAVYFGSAGIIRTRHTVPAALAADLTGFLASAFAVRLFFGA